MNTPLPTLPGAVGFIVDACAIPPVTNPRMRRSLRLRVAKHSRTEGPRRECGIQHVQSALRLSLPTSIMAEGSSRVNLFGVSRFLDTLKTDTISPPSPQIPSRDDTRPARGNNRKRTGSSLPLQILRRELRPYWPGSTLRRTFPCSRRSQETDVCLPRPRSKCPHGGMPLTPRSVAGAPSWIALSGTSSPRSSSQARSRKGVVSKPSRSARAETQARHYDWQ